MELTKPLPDPEEVAQYVAAMAHELRTVAAKADLGFLAYLLGMVEDEATVSARDKAEHRESRAVP